MKCHELDVIVENTSAHHLIAKVKDIFLAASDLNEKNENEKNRPRNANLVFLFVYHKL